MSSPRRSSGARRRGALAAVLSAALLALASGAPAALAETANHTFIGPLVSGATGMPVHSILEDPCGAAVDALGNVYVSDYYHRQVGILGSQDYAAAIGNVGAPNGPCGLAVDAAGRIYVNHWHGGVVRYTPSFYPFGPFDPLPTYSAQTILSDTEATGIALDPVSGDLYVDERTSIAVYGAPVEPNEKVPALRIGSGSLEDGYGVAVSTTTGYVYAADAADNTVKAYDPAAPDPDVPVREIDGAGTPQAAAGGFVSLVDSSLAIDQSNDHLFVADNLQPGFEHPTAAVDEFNGEGLFRGALERKGGPLVHGGPVGIAVDESSAPRKHDVYVTSGNGSNVVLGPYDPEQSSSLLAFGPAGAGQVLEATTSGAGQGAVKSSPAGIACPGACKAEFNAGAAVVLTAKPAPGSVFAGWTGGGCSGTGSCQLTLGAPTTTVEAKFESAPAPLAAASARVVASPQIAAAPVPVAVDKKPKRARHRFAHAKTIAPRVHRRSKESR